MTQTEKDQKLAELKTRLEMLENERRALEAAPVTPQFKVWEPEDDTLYWDSTTIDQYYSSPPIRSSGICHPTKESAERHHSFLVMLHDLHKFAVEHNEGWKMNLDDPSQEKFSVYFNIYRNQLSVSTGFSTCYGAVPYFKTNELAQKAIDTFGDRLKILFEYYNS